MEPETIHSELPNQAERLPLRFRLLGYAWVVICCSRFLSELYFGTFALFSLFGIYLGRELLCKRSRGRNFLLYISEFVLFLFFLVMGTLLSILIYDRFKGLEFDPSLSGVLKTSPEIIYRFLASTCLYFSTVVILSSQKAASYFSPLGSRENKLRRFKFRMEHLFVLMTLAAVTSAEIGYKHKLRNPDITSTLLKNVKVPIENGDAVSWKPINYLETTVEDYTNRIKSIKFEVDSLEDYRLIGDGYFQKAAKLHFKNESDERINTILRRSEIQITHQIHSYTVPLDASAVLVQRYIDEFPPSELLKDYHQFLDKIGAED